MENLEEIQSAVPQCRQCDRLVSFREKIARDKRRAYLGETYWGRPVPGWGDKKARLLLVGLAPGAHGANRTGRLFTGDKSADFLFAAMHWAGFASQPRSISREDGMRLSDVYISNVIRCVPPENKPTSEEIGRCRPYLLEEILDLPDLKSILALGMLAFEQSLLLLTSLGISIPSPRPVFSHGCSFKFGKYTLIGSYHPSQRNTSTKLLTPAMMDKVFTLARLSLTRDNNPADQVD